MASPLPRCTPGGRSGRCHGASFPAPLGLPGESPAGKGQGPSPSAGCEPCIWGHLPSLSAQGQKGGLTGLVALSQGYTLEPPWGLVRPREAHALPQLLPDLQGQDPALSGFELSSWGDSIMCDWAESS